ncbi:DNA-binding transcriptional regulator Fis [Kineobactrum salinum]|uniref:Putative Fis-like DNA-binding protein n=1 Tax=Kineobactrum salinum TaxID=2708301 RepID=A0A6C0U6E5_9GAMM|nr:DNA-binding transcriptional regulator Fis [Kineobactrum salinum]QIB65995.1 DNA-binding transcriptional regulator Fis [Kineobactrum salinum]
MTQAEHLAALAPVDPATSASESHDGHLCDAVTRAVRAYLEQLDGQTTTDFYDLVLAEVEAPLLREIMAYTRNNQTRASRMLGLNRGTLRKKLKQYHLLSDNS